MRVDRLGTVAQELGKRGDLDLADRAYAAAFEAEPTNAQLLWDRAEALRRAGKRAEAEKLYRQLADGDWQPRFRWLQREAKLQVP
jgi:Flp pilus assembly protein TadD